MRQIVSTEKAPSAIGPYSQGIIFEGRLIYTAGSISLDADSGEIVGKNVEEQTRKAILNMGKILEAAGSGIEHVVKTTVFLKDMNDFSRMNEVYTEFFEKNQPARSAVEVSRLPKDVLFEIECLAIVP